MCILFACFASVGGGGLTRFIQTKQTQTTITQDTPNIEQIFYKLADLLRLM